MASGMTQKADSDDHGPMGRGPVLGYDPRPLTSHGVGAVPTGPGPACGSLRPLARDSPTGAAGGASSDCKSRIDRAPVYPLDRPDCSTAAAVGKASSGYKSGVGTGSIAARAPVRSSDRPAHLAASAAGGDGTCGAT